MRRSGLAVEAVAAEEDMGLPVRRGRGNGRNLSWLSEYQSECVSNYIYSQEPASVGLLTLMYLKIMLVCNGKY